MGIMPRVIGGLKRISERTIRKFKSVIDLALKPTILIILKTL